MNQFDIFISYRRDGGFEVADSIYQRLISSKYSVFLDIEQLNSGKFNTKLLNTIEGCKDFLLVLPPHALDRCNEENDWVRLEVEQAIRTNKNIIPIMLRGFEWPDSSELPESLRSLPNYNGIAANHEVYSENIERLKDKFLISKPISWWRRHKHLLYIMLFVVISLVATIGVLNMGSNEEAKQHSAEYSAVCNDYVAAIFLEYLKMDSNFALAEDVKELWDEFLIEYDIYDKEQLVQELESLIGEYRSALNEPEVSLVSDADMAILRKEYPYNEDFMMAEMLCQSYYDEINDYFDSLIRFANSEHPAKMKITANKHFETLKSSLLFNYCSILAICSTMPKSVEPIVESAVSELSTPTGITIGQERKAYESLREQYLNNAEADITDMAKQVEKFGSKVDAAEKIQQQINRAESYFEKAYEQYDKAINYKLTTADDFSSAWNKVCTLATSINDFGQAALLLDELYELFHNELKEAKLETSESNHDFIDEQKLKTDILAGGYHKLYELLHQFEQYNFNNDTYISTYVNAASIYYAGVAAGILKPNLGLMVFSTLNDRQHPTFQVGDVIIEMNGHPIANADDFIAARGQGECPVKFMRVNDKGYMDELMGIIPKDCAVTIDVLPLYSSLK